jgi:hypothetical protein
MCKSGFFEIIVIDWSYNMNTISLRNDTIEELTHHIPELGKVFLKFENKNKPS